MWKEAKVPLVVPATASRCRHSLLQLAPAVFRRVIPLSGALLLFNQPCPWSTFSRQRPCVQSCGHPLSSSRLPNALPSGLGKQARDNGFTVLVTLFPRFLMTRGEDETQDGLFATSSTVHLHGDLKSIHNLFSFARRALIACKVFGGFLLSSSICCSGCSASSSKRFLDLEGIRFLNG